MPTAPRLRNAPPDTAVAAAALLAHARVARLFFDECRYAGTSAASQQQPPSNASPRRCRRSDYQQQTAARPRRQQVIDRDQAACLIRYRSVLRACGCAFALMAPPCRHAARSKMQHAVMRVDLRAACASSYRSVVTVMAASTTNARTPVSMPRCRATRYLMLPPRRRGTLPVPLQPCAGTPRATIRRVTQDIDVRCCRQPARHASPMTTHATV